MLELPEDRLHAQVVEMIGRVRRQDPEIDSGALRRRVHELMVHEVDPSQQGLARRMLDIRVREPDLDIDQPTAGSTLIKLSDNSVKGAAVEGYTLDELMGVRTRATLWRAHSMYAGLHVVIKFFRSADDELPQAVQTAMTLREVQVNLASSRQHNPNVIAVYDAGWGRDETQARVPYIAMEYVKGCTLKEWRAVNVPTAREAVIAVYIVIEAAASLWQPRAEMDGDGVRGAPAPGKAPPRPILHNDISPYNILVNGGVSASIDKATLKLIDFAADNVTTSGYTAPERLTTRDAAIEGWDIYSLGATLFFLLTSFDPPQPPRAPVDFESLPVDVSPELRAIVRKSMAVDPADRYATRREFSNDLVRYVENYPMPELGLKYNPFHKCALLIRRARDSKNIVAQSKLWALFYVWATVNIAAWISLCWLLPVFGVDRNRAFDITGVGLSIFTGSAAVALLALTWKGVFSRKMGLYNLTYIGAYCILRFWIVPDFSKGASVQVLLSSCFAVIIGISEEALKVWIWLGLGFVAVTLVSPSVAQSPRFDPIMDATLQATTFAIWCLGFAITFWLKEERPPTSLNIGPKEVDDRDNNGT